MVSIRRALVECVVLSLQDNAVFYPCCKGCFSKINVKQRERCRCFKCGYSCPADLVEYRYRLSLKVVRDGCIFGLTVFGTCLNPFFGIDASGLQRLVINVDDPVGTAARSTLLLKAVQDCFIGRHLIFGIKLNETEPLPWIKAAVQNGSGKNRKAQVVASQMLHPKALVLEGCTVVSYYQRLLQKAVESQVEGADLNKNPRRLPQSLLVNYSPQNSFSDGALWTSARLSNSALSSDSSFTSTPPFQHSLRLVILSAEREENDWNQNSGGEDDNNAGRFNLLYLKKGDCPKDQKDSEVTSVSPLKKEVTLLSQRILCPWSPRHTSPAKGLSTKDLTEPSTSSSVAWDDLPFSESLMEFLCEKQGCDVTEPEENAHNKKDTPRITPQEHIFSIHSSPASASDHLRVLMDITNTPGVKEADGRGFSKLVGKSHVTSVNACSNGCNEEKEEHFEEEFYNCSADLFSNSVPVNTVTGTPNRMVRSITKTRLLLSDKRPTSVTMTVSGVTPSKHKLTQKRNDNKDSLLPPDTPQLDFIPLSQSTPVMRAGAPASYRCSTSVGLSSLPDIRESSGLESHTPAKISLSLCKCDPIVWPLNHHELSKTTSDSHSDKFALKLQFWKPEVTERHLLPLQCRKLPRAAPNIAPTENSNNTWDTDSGYVPACGGNNKMLIPPTLRAESQPSGDHRKRSHADNSSPNLDCVWEEEQEDGVNCGGTARNQTFTSLCSWLNSTQDTEAVVEAVLGAFSPYLLDESKARDMSRDLFSDSA